MKIKHAILAELERLEPQTAKMLTKEIGRDIGSLLTLFTRTGIVLRERRRTATVEETGAIMSEYWYTRASVLVEPQQQQAIKSGLVAARSDSPDGQLRTVCVPVMVEPCTPRRAGRPIKADDAKLSQPVKVRFTTDEYARIQQIGRRLGSASDAAIVRALCRQVMFPPHTR